MIIFFLRSSQFFRVTRKSRQPSFASLSSSSGSHPRTRVSHIYEIETGRCVCMQRARRDAAVYTDSWSTCIPLPRAMDRGYVPACRSVINGISSAGIPPIRSTRRITASLFLALRLCRHFPRILPRSHPLSRRSGSSSRSFSLSGRAFQSTPRTCKKKV